MRFRIVSTLLVCLLGSTTALAASGDALTGTGASMSSSSAESELLVKERKDRAEGLRQAILQDHKADTAYRAAFAAFLRKRAELRRDCRDALRRSNRDTRMDTLIRCYTSDLTLERDLLAKRRDRVAAMPGVTAGIRDAGLARLDLLADAMDTITFALESGVYADENEVLEAKANLLAKYRKPFWDAMMRLRADRALSIAAGIIVRADEVSGIEAEEKGEARPEWAEQRMCLTEQEDTLRWLAAPSATGGGDAVSSALTAIEQCGIAIRALTVTASGSGSTLSGTGAVK